MKVKIKLKPRGLGEKSFWDKHPHHLTDSTFRFTLDVWVLAKITKYKPSKVVDLGCGEGKVRNYYRNSTKDSTLPWIGVDTRESLRAAFSKKNSEFFQCDLGKTLPEELLPLEFVVCTELLEHLQPKEAVAFLDRVCKGLKRGGRIVMTTPGPEDFNLERDFKRFGHVWSPKLSDISPIVKKHKCEIVECWSGRFFNDKIREPKLIKQITEEYGEGAADIVRSISKRYHPRITCALFSHLFSPPCSHIQCVIEKK